MAEAATNMTTGCPICHGEFTEPRVLPCSHTVCYGCLEDKLKLQAGNDYLSCPVCDKTCHISPSGLKNLPCGDRSFITECCREISGMTSYHNHLYIVHENDDNLYVYENNKMKKSVAIFCNKDKMRTPHGVCLVKTTRVSHSLVISDHDGQCLWWLTIEKHADDVKLGQPKQHDLHYHPNGVNTNSSGRAVVADMANSCIYVYNQPGEHTKPLQLSRALYPRQALADGSGGYVIRHSISNEQLCGRPTDELLWVSCTGIRRSCYTDQPAVQPYHIAYDGTALLVCDRSNRCVHVVKMNGKHHGYVSNDIDPTGVCLDPAGHYLWVAYKGKDKNVHVKEMVTTPEL